MFAAAIGLGAWSLAAAWLLHAGRVRPGDVWGWSTTGNVLQGGGLILWAAGMLIGTLDRNASTVEPLLLQYGPAGLVVAGVALRFRARRDARDTETTGKRQTGPEDADESSDDPG